MTLPFMPVVLWSDALLFLLLGVVVTFCLLYTSPSPRDS